MKAVREIESKRVFYLFADDVDVYIGEDLEAGGVIALHINSQVHEIVDAPQPELFVGNGVLSFDADWSVADQKAYDKAVAEADRQAGLANAAIAKLELLDTDWCENASVRNEAVTPHLTNAVDFDTYRLALRVIVVTKPAKVETWPTSPAATWSE